MTNHDRQDHMGSGLRVPSNTVPAVKDVCPGIPDSATVPATSPTALQSIGSVGKQTRPDQRNRWI